MSGEGEAAEILDVAQGRFLLIGENARKGDFVGLDQIVPSAPSPSIEEAARNQQRCHGSAHRLQVRWIT